VNALLPLVSFSALMLLVGSQEGHSVPLILGGSCLELMEEEDQVGNWLTQVHLENDCQNNNMNVNDNMDVFHCKD